MSQPIKGNNHDYSRFDNMSTEALEEILRLDAQLPDDEESDVDAILYITEVIEKREKEHPTGRFKDVHTAWASFNENYLPYAEDGKSLYDFEDIDTQQDVIKTPLKKFSSPQKKRRMMRVASITSIIITMLLAGTLTANALGFDLWDTVAKWTRDTFGFSSTATATQGNQGPNNGSEYKSLQDAFDSYAITAKLAPTCFPDGYSLENITVNETPAQTIIHAIYSDEDNDEISINIILLSKLSTRTYEKDGSNVTVYSTNGIEHYIMSNLGQTKIVWQAENYECSISGLFTLDEAKKMIDSIYERN